MRVDVFSIFPAAVDTFCSASLLGKARQTGVLDLRCHDIREHATDVHRTVDDAPFGGGAGMLMKAEPIFAAVEAVGPVRPLLLLGPGGRRFDQGVATELADGEGFSLLCGRYEGVDHRVREHLVDGELSVGDVVLSGGESAACLVVDAVTRLLPGAMGNDASTVTESFGVRGLLEEPQYTRPAIVPRLGRARRAGQRQPRGDRALAPGPGAAPHDRYPARPDRAPRRSHRRRAATVGRVPAGPVSLTSPPRRGSAPTAPATRTNRHESHRRHRQRPTA